MKKIGITGNIGCGKSTVCKIFADKYDIPVWSADIAAKHLIADSEDLKKQIHLLFGDAVFNDDQTINRKYIFNNVFSDRKTLDKYNAILHPPVIKAFNEWCLDRMEENHPYVIEESALIFEAGSFRSFDDIICVIADYDTRISRAAIRSGLTIDEVKLIESHQLHWIEKWRRSSLSIMNTCNVTHLENCVDNIHQLLTYRPASQQGYGHHLEEVMRTVNNQPSYAIKPDEIN